MPDEMKARAFQICHQRRFTLHFLHVILAEFAQPGRPRFAYYLRTEYLRDREQTDRLRIPAGTGACARNPLTDQIQPLIE